MIPRIDNRMYTNLVLTMIALLLAISAAGDFGVNITESARAQDTNSRLTQAANGLSIDPSIPQSQDVAVAAATSDVANANRDIAAAIRELADAVRTGTQDIRSGLESAAGGKSSSARSATSSSGERPVVEVGP